MNAPRDLPALARSQFIGGSDIASILGCSPYKSAVELYLEKRGEAPCVADNAILRRGRRLEPYVREMYAEETGRRVADGAFVVGREPWICANLDGISGLDKMDRVLEIKTANPFTRRDWGDEGTDRVPVYYTAQLQWYLMVTGMARADLAALIGLDDFRIFTIEADCELQASLLDRARVFWQRVQDRSPPPAVSSEDLARLFPKHQQGAVVEASDVDLGVLQELRRVRAQIDEFEAQESVLKMSLQARIGEAEALTLDGIPLATWKAQSRRSVDVKALREQHPEIAEQFERVGTSRVFRVK